MALFCSACGTQLTDESAFCFKCGKPVTAASEDEQLFRLLKAIDEQDATTVRELLEQNRKLVRINAELDYSKEKLQKGNYPPPLVHAVRKGNIRVIEAVLSVDPDVNAVYPARERYMEADLDEVTLLHQVTSIPIANLLIKHGADVNAQVSSYQIAPLHRHIAKEPYPFDIVQLLLQNGANPNIKTSSNITPLQLALRRYKTAVVELLLQYNADIRLVSKSTIDGRKNVAGLRDILYPYLSD